MILPFGHAPLPRASALLGWTGLLLLFVAGYRANADDLPSPITLDLPVPANLATPSWLGHPETPAAAFATLVLPITAPDVNASLLVTVYFQEKQDGFMRITWKGPQNAQVLSDNFYENIGMANQRSLLIAASTLVGDGELTFQCSDSTLGIQRIKLEWLANKNSLVSPSVTDSLVTPSTGPTQSAQALNGQANPVQPGAWENQIVSVPLTDQALRIEQGVDFNVDLDQVPNSARLAVQETGLPLGEHLVVWVNEQRAGTITPAVPDLLDGGFLASGNAASGYVGWRDGSFFVPVSLLKAGVNTVQFSDESDGTATLTNTTASATTTAIPVAIKNLVLQLNYTSTPAGTDTIPSEPVQSATTPTDSTASDSSQTDSSTPQFLTTGPTIAEPTSNSP